jgi:predicted  nucleic acid-binding Zn-ribbon protein
VKGLLSDMITKLEDQAATDASHKEYCDKELGDTAQKKLEKGYEIDKLTTKIDTMTAKSASLKEEVSELQKALADLATAQAEMTNIRQEEHAAFTKNKPDMEQGLEGVKIGLKVLREYYAKEDTAHETASGAGESIISLLEVVESDFSKLLAEMIASENSADLKYETEAYLNKVEKTSKEQDVKYKTEEYKKLDAAVAEATSDREGVQTELSAILDYKAHLQEICSSKAESYGERKARRDAEVAGLKEALSILEGEAVLLQREAPRPRTGFLRPVAAHQKASR